MSALVEDSPAPRPAGYFRAMVENASDLVVVLDADAVVRFVSPSLQRVLGYPVDELGGSPLLGSDAFSLVHPKDRPGVTAAFAAEAAGVATVPHPRFRVRHADGSWRVMEAAASNLLHEPDVAGIVVHLRDVTGEVRAEAARDASERRARALFSLSNDALLLHDLAGRIHDANDRACELLGYSRSTLLVTPISELASDTPQLALRQQWRALAEAGAGRWESRWRRADGAPLDVELSSRFLPEQGGLVLTLVRDLAERRASDQARQRRFLAQVLDGLPNEGVMVHDPDGHLLYANATAVQLSGHSSLQAMLATEGNTGIGQFTIRDALGREVEPADLVALRAPLGEAGGEMLLSWRSNAGGEERWSLVRSMPVRDAEGRIELMITVFRDITALRQAESRYRSIVESAREAIFRTTGRQTFATVNPAAAALMGYASADQLVGEVTSVHQLFVDQLRYSELVARLVMEGAVDDFEVELRRRDGTTCWVSLRMHLNEPGNLAGGMQGTAIDITARRLAEQYRYQALHDPLTGLANRALFTEQMGRALELAQSERGQLAVLQIDLDGFKQVNDTYGHETGDALLIEFAARLRAAVRAADTSARMGGDEFSVLLPGTGMRGAIATAEKLLAAAALPFVTAEATINAGMSIGIAIYPDHGRTADALLRRADTAMYIAKLERRGYAVSSSSTQRISD
ncbi:MAG TPA: PAS domain S-box protein [Dehalococcoidia bacterium]